MSLQLAAQHLAAQGRGPDKQLVHMSPREVAGLQALAMAHGGSLSINPETGLPEAGFLDSLLPTIIGAGLAFATGGTSLALSPAMIGLGVGGIQALRTGDLSKGLMAGLGAYGGAGLFSSLAGPGMAVTNPQAAQIATAQTAAPAAQAAQAGVTGAAGITGVPVAPYEFGAATAAEQAAMQNALAAPTASVNPYGVLDPGTYANYFPGMGTETGGIPVSAQEHLQAMSKLTGAPPATPMPAAPAVAPSNSVDFLSGMSDVSAVEGPGVAGAGLPTRSSTFASRLAAMPTKDLAKYGLAAAAPVLLAPPEYKKPELDSEQYRYAYSPGPVMPPTRSGDVGEYTYFRPSYTRLAEGGSTDGYRYEYDPVRQAYKQSLPPKTSEGGKEKTVSGDTRGDGGGSLSSGALSSGRETGINPFSAIAAGEAIQGFGRGLGGFMPGGMLANAIGGGLVGYGQNAIAQNQANLDAEMGAAMNAAETAAQMDAMSNAQAADVAGANAASNASGMSADTGTEGIGFYKGGITALARGGYSNLGDYSDGGRLLRGPGDGVSDSIPAVIGDKRPARLADGEFVVPARIVSELGNGSTDAGARKLYAMMDRIQSARGKTTGKGKVAKNTRSEKYLPA